MAPLTIRLLGIPEIRDGKRPVSFRTRKVLALLVYLVVEGGRHSRESLVALLWPESPSNSAAATLRVTLSRLRRALQPAGEYILSEGSTLAFDFERAHDLDLAWLAAAAHTEMPPAELAPILALDRGEFLEGFSLPDAPAFDTWAAIQREVCQRQLETVYDRLSQHQLATHDSAAALETAARWVARAPLSEQAYRRLMAAQALSGQRPAALKTYQQLQATLQQKMGLEPSRETAVLADHISRGRVGREDTGTMIMAGEAHTKGPARRLTLPLVGRAEEHGQLVAAFRLLGQDGAQVVALIGAAGVGKTRLVSAFQDWAMLDSPEAEVWQGRAFETGGRLAYQPVVEAMRLRLEQENAPEDLLDDVWLAELSQLMPELRARYPDLPPPMTGDAHFVRAHLFEAVALLGSALAARRPAVFVLDDMQWADADTLDLVHYLTRRWVETGAPIMLLLTVRQEAYAADAALREWLNRLERDVTLTRLLLDSLSGATVQQLVGRLSDEQADERAVEAAASAFAAWLWAETRGLPFFIDALLQMLVEQGLLTLTDPARPAYDFSSALDHVRSAARVPLPPGVREVIQARLAQHSKEAGALLLAAAVLGRACTFERLCQVADLAETPALEAVEALLDGRLLTEWPAGRRPYTLAHDYIREVVYTESREARRRVAHRRALLALEAAGAPAAECAFHALAALLDEPAFRYSVTAGGEAFATYAVQEALAHFETALNVAQRMEARGETVDAVVLGRLYRGRGQVLELIQDDQAAQENYETMRAVAVQRQDRAMELVALIAQSNLHGIYSGVFNPPKARELGSAALVLARELGDKPAEAGALAGLMQAELFGAGASELVMTYGQQSLALARELGLQELASRVLTNLCWPYFARRQIEEALGVLEETKAILRSLGNLPQLTDAFNQEMILSSGIGDHRRILAKAPEMAELSVAIGSRLNEGNALAVLAVVHARQGRFDQALACIEKAQTVFEAAGNPISMQGLAFIWMGIYLAAGTPEQAEPWADRLYPQRQAMIPNTVPIYFTNIAWTKIACGKLDEGQAILDELLADLPYDEVWSYAIVPMAVAYGHLHLAQGRPEALFAGLEERVRPFRKAGFVSLLADELWLRGRAELALGRLEAARASLLEARAAAEAQEERSIQWQILATLSEMERKCGQVAAAARWGDQAQAMVDDIAAHAGALRAAFLGQPAVAQLLEKT